MTHYRQVIIDLSVDDETDESELEKLKGYRYYDCAGEFGSE